MRDRIVILAHGGGGALSRELIERVFRSRLANPVLDTMDDSAVVEIGPGRCAFTTDSYVVRPLEFPGGDIGRLAVCGTVNDLAMQGADPLHLSLGMILEEGLEIELLERVVDSIAAAAAEAGVSIATGDTKVVERGRGDGIYVNTSGIGRIRDGVDVGSGNARPGDAVIVTGTLGDHGIAVLSRREGIAFETELISDVAPLNGLVGRLLEAVPGVHCLRDPTRGGLAAALNDIARDSGVGIRIREPALPVRREVRGACALFGFDPLDLANEGKAVVICPEAEVERALQVLRAHPLGRDAVAIGDVVGVEPGIVIMETEIGGERIVEIPSGENLPRIC